MRATICALLVSLTLGCVPPAGGGEGTAVELELRPLEVEGGWRLELWNGSDEHVVLGCQDGICAEVPTVRYEAQQADGTWVERPSYTRFARELNLPGTVARRSSFVLGDGHYNLTDLDAAPGTYRAVVHTRNAGDVTLEYAVLGWSTETRRAALAIRARADAAGCGRLVQRCGGLGDIDMALVGHLEPDALIDMHEGASDEVQPTVREAMLERGGFVLFLSELLSVGSMETVREVATWLGSRADPIQEPLRAVVAERLTDPLFGHGVVSTEDYELIHEFEGYWPDQTAARIVGRLEHGPEEGATLIALLDVLGSSWGDAFESYGPRILAALPARCEGATDEWLVANCELVATVYDPNIGFGFGGLGMRGTGCSGCGGSYHPPAACGAIYREWNELEAAAGELELVWLGSSI